jgi:hypothetical protein
VSERDLPPTQYLVMEVLAARYRTGENFWTFPSSLRQTLDALVRADLVNVYGSPAPGSFRVGLTEAGCKHSLKPDYVPPVGAVMPPVIADDVQTVLNQRHLHAQSVPGVWDDSRQRCAECAARARLANALRALAVG